MCRKLLLPQLLIFLISLISLSIAELATHQDAFKLISSFSDNLNNAPLYNQENIENKLRIPQFNNETKRYEPISFSLERETPGELLESVDKIRQHAEKTNDSKSYSVLADIYMFGNYSIPPDYQKAKSYYEKAVEGYHYKDNGLTSKDVSTIIGHSYFMLGFIHSTGLFGEFPKNQALATLYYQFGMENGDTNSILALAYRSLNGIGTPANCELALHYYTRLAHIGMINLSEQKVKEDSDDSTETDEIEEFDVYYNVRLPDFNGGLYGSKVSEVMPSIYSHSKMYSNSRDAMNEYNLDINEHIYIEYYYDAIAQYEGDYFTPKNHTKAAIILRDCVEEGELNFGKSKYRNMEYIDQVFLSKCQALLGRMFLKGQGKLTKDYEKAYSLLRMSIKVLDSQDALNDLGVMHELELIEKTANQTKAISYYQKAIKLKSRDAMLNLAKFLISKAEDENVFKSVHKKYIYTLVQDAVYEGSNEALYYFGDFVQSGLSLEVEPEKSYTCDNCLIYYKLFVNRLEKFFLPHLKFAFEELLMGNYQNSLIGYSMAAEQGLEHSQISAAYLLYQPDSLLDKILGNTKTFTKERIDAAIGYLELASSQNNLDATVMLGDLYWDGVDGGCLTRDYRKAFNYYNKAALLHSSHACFNLGLMYEYGLGFTNDTADFFMAKRYYDLSLKHKKSNRIPVNLALLRLRLKYLFNWNGAANGNTKNKDQKSIESGGWFKAFKNLGKQRDIERSQNEVQEVRTRADAHHEGDSFTDEEHDAGDYLVIFLTFMFFSVFFFQNLIRQFRRVRNNNNNNDEDAANLDNDENGVRIDVPQNRFGQVRVNFGNFEFQAFAL